MTDRATPIRIDLDTWGVQLRDCPGGCLIARFKDFRQHGQSAEVNAKIFADAYNERLPEEVAPGGRVE